MKNDTQHLEFLISQFVDGTLDAATRKTIEQQLLTDPVARRIYKEQHETQELLDDWGNRLPMINWAEFDNVLATRLEKEAVVPEKISLWRKWSKPLAIAASLFVAAGVGYAFHAMQADPASVAVNPLEKSPPESYRAVRLEGPATPKGAGIRSVDYSVNVPNKSVAGRGKVEIGGDPGRAIQQGLEEGSAYWPITPSDGPGDGLSLPQTQPGAVRAQETPGRGDFDGLQ
jgi:hypothetical protein